MDKLAIVILNWNGVDMLRQYLPIVLRYSRDDATIYVADNASTDDSVAFVKAHFPEVRLILLERNWGFAEGYNRALAQVEAEYYLLLNSDIEVTHHWLQPLVEFMDNHPHVAACQPKLLSMADHDWFEYAGACGGYLDRLGYPFCRGRIFDTVERDNGQYDLPTQIHWATGAALFVRSSIYKEVGGLDPRFFAHQEEIDMCWRIRIKGYQIYCLPDSQVYHLGGGTLPKSNPMKTYLNFRNNLTMLYKCLPESDLHRVMRMRWWLDYMAAWQSLLLKHSWGDFKAVYRARRDFKRWRKDFEQTRQQIQKNREGDGQTERIPLSILWQYYVKGRKTFTSCIPANS